MKEKKKEKEKEEEGRERKEEGKEGRGWGRGGYQLRFPVLSYWTLPGLGGGGGW